MSGAKPSEGNAYRFWRCQCQGQKAVVWFLEPIFTLAIFPRHHRTIFFEIYSAFSRESLALSRQVVIASQLAGSSCTE